MCKCLRSILLLLFLATLTAAQSDEEFLIAEEDLASPLTFKILYRVGKSDFNNVYVVTMKLDWLQYCGNLCAMKFNASRNVVLNEDGKVLAIENDGCARGVVS